MSTPLYLALILLAGFAGGKLASALNLPSVTGYLIFGLILGPSFLNIVTTGVYESFSLITNFAVSMLTMSVGMELHRDIIRKNGKRLIVLSTINTGLSFILVSLLVWFLGLELRYALILGVASMTVSPAGVVGIIKDQKASGKMTNQLLELVAFDNLLCVILFGIVLSFVSQAQDPETFSVISVLLSSIGGIFISLIIGAITGALYAYFVTKEPVEETLLVVFVSVILLNIGVSNYLDVSPILTSIISGIVLTNLSSKPGLITSVYQRAELPIFILFLTLSGAHIKLSMIFSIGMVGFGYIGARALGRWGGIYIASFFTDLDQKIGKNLGIGLLPQAGIAIGLITIAEQTLQADGVMSGVILSSVIVFEIFGPLLLREGIKNVGESKVAQ